ncbi:MAG: retroviral-like aspartic protease family protein [Gammaproteobacteria bacterium]
MAFFSGPVRGGKILIRVAVLRPDAQSKNVLPQHAYAALVDTGAMSSCISPKVVESLGLVSEGLRTVRTASGKIDVRLYHVDLHILVGMLSGVEREGGGEVRYSVFSKTKLEVSEIAQPQSFDVLVGMDVLSECSLFVSGGQFTFCY